VSALLDEPVDLELPNGDRWQPQNFDKQLRGQVTVVRALTQSLNLPTVQLGLDVGLDKVARTFQQLGLDEPPAELPSMLLGATNLSPLEVAQVYNTLANGGFRSPLRAVRAVVDEQGQALKAPELEVAEAVSPEAVYTLDRMLVEVMERGTGRAARRHLSPGLVVAGKTGTSNDYRDSWFAGFSGSHLVVSWVGHDDNSPTGLTGTTGGLAVWSRLMGSIVTSSFDPILPEALEHRWVDYFTGLETSPDCGETAVSLPFPVGTLLEQDFDCTPDSDGLLPDGVSPGTGPGRRGPRDTGLPAAAPDG
jgi:penicillin-binding protein 1B